MGKVTIINVRLRHKLNNYVKDNKNGDNYIIYCFDTDRIDCNQEDITKFEDEKMYCNNKKYELIWFNYDIEYVLLGKKIESNKKKQESIKFNNKKKIVISCKKLFCNNERVNGSNIYAEY